LQPALDGFVHFQIICRNKI